MENNHSVWKLSLIILGLASALSVLAYFSFDYRFHLVFCDVGQGDAILASYKNTQILIDGGANNRVIDCLSSKMPFWDRTIEAVVLTHPEEDHYFGLIEVFNRYRVDNFIANAADTSTQQYRLLQNKVGGVGSRVVNPTAGQSINIGKIYLDIFWPTETFLAEKYGNYLSGYNTPSVLGAYATNANLNEFSVGIKLTFGEFDAILPGDLAPPVINLALDQIGQKADDVEILKIPHHGSKNGLTADFLSAIRPALAIISVGKNNYGHPSLQILEMLNRQAVDYLRTDEFGDIEIISNGRSWQVNKNRL